MIAPRLTAEEQRLIAVLEQAQRRKLNAQQIALALEQARALGQI
jgi:hypothetical protein